jgi:hypothetical protein
MLQFCVFSGQFVPNTSSNVTGILKIVRNILCLENLIEITPSVTQSAIA